MINSIATIRNSSRFENRSFLHCFKQGGGVLFIFIFYCNIAQISTSHSAINLLNNLRLRKPVTDYRATMTCGILTGRLREALCSNKKSDVNIQAPLTSALIFGVSTILLLHPSGSPRRRSKGRYCLQEFPERHSVILFKIFP